MQGLSPTCFAPTLGIVILISIDISIYNIASSLTWDFVTVIKRFAEKKWIMLWKENYIHFNSKLNTWNSKPYAIGLCYNFQVLLFKELIWTFCLFDQKTRGVILRITPYPPTNPSTHLLSSCSILAIVKGAGGTFSSKTKKASVILAFMTLVCFSEFSHSNWNHLGGGIYSWISC